ncbi:hypothetical protein Sjap_019241 [Stephania japonica]|uniref:Uncharacterized protein n=1 Tax=Stephania japonica TaxID=461633 RepID=A0AAP0F3W7_9MAGN
MAPLLPRLSNRRRRCRETLRPTLRGNSGVTSGTAEALPLRVVVVSLVELLPDCCFKL